MVASEREEMLDRMQRLPERLARLIEDKPEEVLRRAGAGGEWGAVEHLAHLRDFDEVSLERVDLILADGDPVLENFDTDLRAIELDYHAQDPHQMLAEFQGLRSALVNRLADLNEEDWHRTAHHVELGEITLDRLVQHIDEHDQAHLHTLKDDLL